MNQMLAKLFKNLSTLYFYSIAMLDSLMLIEGVLIKENKVQVDL